MRIDHHANGTSGSTALHSSKEHGQLPSWRNNSNYSTVNTPVHLLVALLLFGLRFFRTIVSYCILY